eukprot:364513-Chlamydomonas_euryale.AAC.8
MSCCSGGPTSTASGSVTFGGFLQAVRCGVCERAYVAGASRAVAVLHCTAGAQNRSSSGSHKPLPPVLPSAVTLSPPPSSPLPHPVAPVDYQRRNDHK